MKKAIRLVAAGGLLAAGVPLSAMAQSINVSATVNSQCNLGTANVAFGSYTLDNFAQNTPTITLTCNKGATPFVALNDGLPANANGTQKRMRRGVTTDYINYNISVPTIVDTTTTQCPGLPGGTEWNATNRLDATSMFVPSGGPRNILVCAWIPAGQGYDVGAGNYNDVVTATVAFN